MTCTVHVIFTTVFEYELDLSYRWYMIYKYLSFKSLKTVRGRMFLFVIKEKLVNVQNRFSVFILLSRIFFATSDCAYSSADLPAGINEPTKKKEQSTNNKFTHSLNHSLTRHHLHLTHSLTYSPFTSTLAHFTPTVFVPITQGIWGS